MKMRDLEQRTGVSREIIRVYLRHGLMPEPHRPKANVADYGEEHVRSVLAIRQLQKEKKLPLERIRRAMDGDTEAMPVDASAFPHLDSLIAARAGVNDDQIPLAALAARNPHAEADARVLASVGAVKLCEHPNGTQVSRIDAQLIGLWAEMRAAGFTEELGFTPDICKLHVAAAEALAHQELEIFLDRVSGQRQEDPTADMAQAALTHLLSFFGLIRLKTVLADLRQRTPR
ncbi:MAG: MerR family transcriptional regulator [Xanthomonadaceae bacterium]|nr:MerR family transcriptional regulator [Xanthomonadaceae bacterium]